MMTSRLVHHLGRTCKARAAASSPASGRPEKRRASASTLNQTKFCGSLGLNRSPYSSGVIASAARPLNIRLRKFRIEFAGLAKQLPRLEMGLARHTMEIPGSASHEIPCIHVACMTRRCLRTFGLEQLRFDGAGHTLGDLILDRKYQIGRAHV